MSHTYPEQHSHFNLTYSIRPAKSLISSSQLIVDYIADKIEQSVPIQQIFNELLRFFETEALCLGPAFIVQTKSSSGENLHSEAKISESVAMLPKIEISSESGTKSDQYEVFQNSSNSLGSTRSGDLSENWNAMHSGRIPMVVAAASNSQRPKVLGFRIICSGRLQISSFSKPAEKAESIEITRGVLPLNSFKANIDFAQTHATNAYGTCGIKV
jgi:hypothetical protein